MHKLIGLALSLLILATPAAAQKVSVDHDRAFDFMQWTTFGWGEASTPAKNEMNQRRIERAIVTQLEEAGMSMVQEGKPDFLIETHAASDQQTSTSNVSVGVGVSSYGSRGRVSVGGSTGGRTTVVQVGSLVINLYDLKSNKLVWQATASDTLKGDIEKHINNAVYRSFKKFPPAPEKKKKK